MKKLIWLVFFHSACFHQQVSAQELQSEFLPDPEAFKELSNGVN